MFDIVDLFRPKMPTTFGSAAWAVKGDYRRAGMFAPGQGKLRGPIIGQVTPAEIGGAESRLLYANGEGHLFTAAPTRAGKGAGQIITNLVDWPGSAVVIDIKGENWRHTAGWRQSQGHRVIRFAPFENGGARWNPIDQINAGAGDEPDSPLRQENVRYLANLMVAPNPHAREPYWDNAAKTLLQGLMLHVATAPLAAKNEKTLVGIRERTMAEVRRLIMLGPEIFNNDFLSTMSQSTETWVRDTAASILQMAPAREQTASVKTILMEHTTLWAYRRVQQATGKSDFSFKELRCGDEGRPPTTIYIVIPPEALSEYRALLRVLIGVCMRELRESWEPAKHDQQPPVLLLLDEFPQLAYMQPIEEALLYLSGYGVKFWFFVQDLSQMQQHYEKTWRQFVANCGTRCFFGISDLETAKIVSEMSGYATVRNRSYQAGVSESDSTSQTNTTGDGSSWGSHYSSSSHSSRSFTTSASRGSNFGTTLAYVGRPLFMADELLRMPYGSMVGFVKGFPAIRGQLVLAYREEPFRARASSAPPP